MREPTFEELKTAMITAVQKAPTKTLREALPIWRRTMKGAPKAKQAEAQAIYDLLRSELARRAD